MKVCHHDLTFSRDRTPPSENISLVFKDFTLNVKIFKEDYLVTLFPLSFSVFLYMVLQLSTIETILPLLILSTKNTKEI